MNWKILFIAFFFGLGVAPLAAQTPTFTLDHNIFHTSTLSSVTMTFSSPYTGNAQLIVYNSAGEVVKNLYNGSLSPNVLQTLTWDGKNLSGENVASGVYIIWLKLDLGVIVKKLIVVR